MDDLLAWLRACLDREEQVATKRGRLTGITWTAVEVAEGRWEVVGSAGRGLIADHLQRHEAEHIAMHDPARVLAEIDAKRKLLDRWADQWWVVEDIARTLAQPYAGWPGWREEWRHG